MGLFQVSREAPARPGTRLGVSSRLPILALQLALVALMGGSFLFNVSEVRGSSMEPGIQDNDRILIDHSSVLLGGIDRGDIVILRYPLDPSLDYVKRVIGVSGDQVTLLDGQVYVNGERLEEPYLGSEAREPWTAMSTRVQEGHVFVLGDNRRRSSDSREFGQVPLSNLRGEVRMCIWPLGRIRLID